MNLMRLYLEIITTHCNQALNIVFVLSIFIIQDSSGCSFNLPIEWFNSLFLQLNRFKMLSYSNLSCFQRMTSLFFPKICSSASVVCTLYPERQEHEWSWRGGQRCVRRR